jgi:hypothetical protein
MNTMNTTLLIGIACLTGIIGDSMLQLGSAKGLGGQTGWGLNDYFKKHGRAESIFIAGGMMVIFYLIFIAINLPINFFLLAIYGVLLDLLFREAMIFKSLDGYYAYFNYFWSAVWGAIPLMMPLLFYKLFF